MDKQSEKELMKAKTKSFVKMVQYLRKNQKEYFRYIDNQAEIQAYRKRITCDELAKKIDKEIETMLDFLSSTQQKSIFQ